MDACYRNAIYSASPDRCIPAFLRSPAGRTLLRRISLKSEDFYCFGAGKASAEMLKALINEGLDPAGGIVSSVGSGKLGKVRLERCPHPLPDGDSVKHTLEIMDELSSLPRDSNILFLLSGGASSMLALPLDFIELEEKRRIIGLMLLSGANIGDINCVRRHLSKVKGGNLARIYYPRRVFTLAISDVPGNRPEDIGSGPTCPDPTTSADAISIMKRYGALGLIGRDKVGRLNSGRYETLKPGDELLSTTSYRIIADNRIAMRGVSRALESLGLQAVTDRKTIMSSSPREIRSFLGRARNAAGKHGAFVAGGEAAVAVRGEGYGGRCQHFALTAASMLEEGEFIVAIATDGKDGNTSSAGAATGPVEPAVAIKYLNEFNSGIYFERAGTNIVGPATGTNVSDIYIYLKTGVPNH
ncbi:MAG: DUF4147 domain-containing protein [Thermoplasmata archaeon YP2-bin.285]|uniref:DUF4147 domain-containing protein n=1 Tax=Candidatus Sysuiplasma superficiale TaxID=2823368 RepID=A0A8J7YJK7_9ARCH|nr:DUF4147 domain-containing protein [Candidatus Sysuiplasma superficiale]